MSWNNRHIVIQQELSPNLHASHYGLGYKILKPDLSTKKENQGHRHFYFCALEKHRWWQSIRQVLEIKRKQKPPKNVSVSTCHCDLLSLETAVSFNVQTETSFTLSNACHPLLDTVLLRLVLPKLCSVSAVQLNPILPYIKPSHTVT